MCKTYTSMFRFGCQFLLDPEPAYFSWNPGSRGSLEPIPAVTGGRQGWHPGRDFFSYHFIWCATGEMQWRGALICLLCFLSLHFSIATCLRCSQQKLLCNRQAEMSEAPSRVSAILQLLDQIPGLKEGRRRKSWRQAFASSRTGLMKHTGRGRGWHSAADRLGAAWNAHRGGERTADEAEGRGQKRGCSDKIHASGSEHQRCRQASRSLITLLLFHIPTEPPIQLPVSGIAFFWILVDTNIKYLQMFLKVV